MHLMKKAELILATAVIALLTTSCNGYEKLLKSNDYNAKYEAAMRYYNENSYSKAIQLFENLTLQYRGRENAEEIAWCYAQALFKEKDYFSAGYHFRRYAKQYPFSDRTEEAVFMSAYCSYMESPSYSLDQTTTREAIAQFESFAERWPRSNHIPEVNHYLDEMRVKLVRKDYEIAYEYYFIEEYRAAYESFKNFLSIYPDAPMREDAMYYMLRSGYLYAIGSREDKQRERLQQVVNDFDRFSTSFNNSKYMKDAQDIYTRTRAALAKLETTEAHR